MIMLRSTHERLTRRIRAERDTTDRMLRYCITSMAEAALANPDGSVSQLDCDATVRRILEVLGDRGDE